MSPSDFVRRAWFAATDLVWPRACLVCDEPVSEPSAWCVCPCCVTAMTTDLHLTCPRCSSTVGPHTDVSASCVRCRNERYRFASAIRFGVYDGRLRDAILRIKQPGGDGLAEILGILFAQSHREKLLASAPQVIVPVPVHWRRWWERRHNQSEGIARGVASVLGIPMMRRAVRRVRGNPKQTASTVEERRRNVQGAFRPTTLSGVRGLRVMLIDDVLTTGATADAAAEAVRSAGAAQVHVAVLAHR